MPAYPSVTASIPLTQPPAWAVLERKLIDVMSESVHPFLEKYTHPDGELIWGDTWKNSRDGGDDLYESSYNWPLLYLLGGGEHLLALGQRQWDAITRQLTRLGPVLNEYERGYDQFHQAESYIYFYLLCLADPTNERNRERAQRFAGLYMNEDPAAPNYDPEKKIIRAPHNGSGGPRWGFTDQEPPSYAWGPGMRVYGLPYEDVPGISHYDDLDDPVLAERMGAVMQKRMGQGDVAGNLMATSLVANAFLLTGDEKYRAWVKEYTDAWVERAAQNDGLLPDNVGLSGEVGETMDGRWYGGLYGWSWPHGYYNIGMAATVAACNAFLLTRQPDYLELPRTQFDRILALGEVREMRADEMSLGHHWLEQFTAAGQEPRMFLVPYRYTDSGWFDYQPMAPVYPTAIWNISAAAADWERVESVRRAEPVDWRQTISFHNKEDGGHEKPWLRFLAGENPDYPEQILQASYQQVCRRLEMIRQDELDLTQVSIHHWQQLNPVTTEALIQLTLGAPQIIYNGGLLHCRVRYFDLDEQRPGLPADVAALVETLEAERTVIHLVNLSPFAERNLLIQAGGFGEHRFDSVRYDSRTSEYPGTQHDYAAPPIASESDEQPVNSRYLHVCLPPATEITLDLATARYVNEPSYGLPW
jgi:hypothetical protein